VKALEFPKTN
jgi:hypothetical protein